MSPEGKLRSIVREMKYSAETLLALGDKPAAKLTAQWADRLDAALAHPAPAPTGEQERPALKCPSCGRPLSQGISWCRTCEVTHAVQSVECYPCGYHNVGPCELKRVAAAPSPAPEAPTIELGKPISASINGEPGKVAFFSKEAAEAYGFKVAPEPARSEEPQDEAVYVCDGCSAKTHDIGEHRNVCGNCFRIIAAHRSASREAKK